MNFLEFVVARESVRGTKRRFVAPRISVGFGPKRTSNRIYDGVDAPDGIDVPKWRC